MIERVCSEHNKKFKITMLKEVPFLLVISIMMEVNLCPVLESLRNVLNQQLLTIFFSYFNMLYPTEQLQFLLFPSFCSWQNGLDFPYITFSVGKLLLALIKEKSQQTWRW